ncbi:MAG TPA: thiamine pyrophosphate-dependent enzyme, partial [Sandaracinaceae bacterium LLY-WYZ-13_1]|nr:thiamine pyrophosphate-dependent enzyme [Sandaracinaceae bacterium LLY-WYZ-13_1]
MDVRPIDGPGNGAGESDLRAVIRADGSADPDLDPKLPGERLAALVSAMLRTRRVDDRLAAMGADGRIGFLPRSVGREAAVIGTAAALDDGDWVFPTAHDWGLALHRGLSAEDFAHRVFGSARDALKGHDMPGGLSARRLRIASVSAPAGTHLPHAVGVAWAARQKGEPLVTSALFDAPEIDAADFHTGLNFAGVMKAPTVFVCRVRRGEPSAAEHAVAYGLEAARCDGSDLLAVIATVREAVERA